MVDEGALVISCVVGQTILEAKNLEGKTPNSAVGNPLCEIWMQIRLDSDKKTDLQIHKFATLYWNTE